MANTLQRPFEVDRVYLQAHLDEMVRTTVADLVSEFLVLPKGDGYIEYSDFRDALEALKRATANFTNFTPDTVGRAIRENSRAFVVLRTIIGMTPPEWADLARSEHGVDVGQGPARAIDRACRQNQNYVRDLQLRHAARLGKAKPTSGAAVVRRPRVLDRLDALIAVATELVARGAPLDIDGFVHRLAKFDTSHGLESLRYAARESVPFAVLLY